MALPIWLAHYIGLPFKEHGRDRAGLDCWGLVRLVMSEQLDLHVPSYATSYSHTTDVAAISELIERVSGGWRQVTAQDETLGDVVVMRLRG